MARGLGLVYGELLLLLIALARLVTVAGEVPSASLQDILVGIGDFKEKLLALPLFFGNLLSSAAKDSFEYGELTCLHSLFSDSLDMFCTRPVVSQLGMFLVYIPLSYCPFLIVLFL